MRHGDHLSWIYASDEEAIATTAQWILDGVARGERILYFTDGVVRDVMLDRWTAAGLDVAALVDTGQLDVVDAASAKKDEPFDPRAMIRMLEDATATAVAEGWTGLRGGGEMSWVLSAPGGMERLDEYEQLVDAFIADASFSGLCGYDQRRFTRAQALALCDVHPVALVGADVVDDRAGTVTWRADRSGFVASGVLDAHIVQTIERRLRFCDPRKTLVIDMSAVDRCDDALAPVLRRAGERVCGLGGQLIVIDPPLGLRAHADDDGRARASGLVMLRRLTDPN